MSNLLVGKQVRKAGPELAALTTAVLLLATGCGEMRPGSSHVTDPERGPFVAPGVQSALSEQIDSLAAAVARAMRDRPSRVALLHILRSSPLVEHKVPLGRIAEEGGVFADRLAEELSVPRSQLGTALLETTPLDLYVPGRSDRKNWTVDAPFEVVGHLGVGEIRTGFRANGPNRVDLRAPRSSSDVARIVIAPTEFRAKRLQQQPPALGAVISDPGDGEIGGLVVSTRPDGSVDTVDLADSLTTLRGPQMIDDGGGGGGTPPPTQYVKLSYVRLGDVFDNGMFNDGGCNELKFTATATGGAIAPTTYPSVVLAPYCPYNTYNFDNNDGIADGANVAPFVPTGAYGSGGRRLFIQVEESDGFPNPDDSWEEWGNSSNPPYNLFPDLFASTSPFGNGPSNHCFWWMEETGHSPADLHRMTVRFTWTPHPTFLQWSGLCNYGARNTSPNL